MRIKSILALVCCMVVLSSCEEYFRSLNRKFNQNYYVKLLCDDVSYNTDLNWFSGRTFLSSYYYDVEDGNSSFLLICSFKKDGDEFSSRWLNLMFGIKTSELKKGVVIDRVSIDKDVPYPSVFYLECVLDGVRYHIIEGSITIKDISEQRSVVAAEFKATIASEEGETHTLTGVFRWKFSHCTPEWLTQQDNYPWLD